MKHKFSTNLLLAFFSNNVWKFFPGTWNVFVHWPKKSIFSPLPKQFQSLNMEIGKIAVCLRKGSLQSSSKNLRQLELSIQKKIFVTESSELLKRMVMDFWSLIVDYGVYTRIKYLHFSLLNSKNSLSLK